MSSKGSAIVNAQKRVEIHGIDVYNNPNPVSSRPPLFFSLRAPNTEPNSVSQSPANIQSPALCLFLGPRATSSLTYSTCSLYPNPFRSPSPLPLADLSSFAHAHESSALVSRLVAKHKLPESDACHPTTQAYLHSRAGDFAAFARIYHTCSLPSNPTPKSGFRLFLVCIARLAHHHLMRQWIFA